MKRLLTMITTAFALHGTAVAIVIVQTPLYMEDGTRVLITATTDIRQLIQSRFPDVTDIEVVSVLTRGIDMYLDATQTGVMVENGRECEVHIGDMIHRTISLLPFLTAVDNPDAASQLEHYLNKVTYDEELWKKIKAFDTPYTSQFKVPGSISMFQGTALQNLLPLLDDERTLRSWRKTHGEGTVRRNHGTGSRSAELAEGRDERHRPHTRHCECTHEAIQCGDRIHTIPTQHLPLAHRHSRDWCNRYHRRYCSMA